MSDLTLDSPPISPAQSDAVTELASTLDRDQSIWLSGYFAGLASSAASLPAPGALAQPLAPAAPASTAAAASGASVVTVLFGSETGNSKEVAGQMAAAIEQRGGQANVTNMADYKPRALKSEQNLIAIVSTHGEGDPPQDALDFFEFLEGKKAPKLPDLNFAVLALGDSTYEFYCSAGKRVDARLEELGAKRIAQRIDCDVDYEDLAAEWIQAATDALELDLAAGGVAPAQAGAEQGAAPGAAATHDKRNPFNAELIENIVLTGRGSSKETRHIELSIEDSGLTYEPGDALGVVAENDPELVTELISELGLSEDASIAIKQDELPLGEALRERLEITAATPRFLEHWAELAESEELLRLRADDQRAERAEYLATHHVLDIVRAYPAPGIDASQLTAGLRPLQPRLYSIASSLAAAPDEVHLTVSTVRYELHGSQRTGVASGHLARLAEGEAQVPVYVQENEHFRLPEDDAAIVMIGAGTGVAPYRAFLQEREERGASGRSWLFFGERNFRSDFLYQVEWQEHLKSGALTKLDLAFSRDSAEKTYVQDRLRAQGAELYSWLEDGAHIYVCGDATNMAPDVHAALGAIVSEQAGIDAETAEQYLTDLKRDRRYRLDVY